MHAEPRADSPTTWCAALTKQRAWLRALAEQRLKEINEAHRIVMQPRKNITLHNQAALVANRVPQHAENLKAGQVVMCGLCETRNRLPQSDQHARARCGVCFALLVLPQQVIGHLTER